jgi:hypothetical protein
MSSGASFDRIAATLAKRLDLPAFNRPAVRNIVLFLALIGFTAGIVLAIRSRPDILDNLVWQAAVIAAAVGTPLAVLMSAFEFVLSARLIGVPVTLAKALDVVVVGSAANLLPIPGGAAVRIAALKGMGVGLRTGTSVTVFIALLWLGVSFAYAGAWIMTVNSGLAGPLFLGSGLVLLIALLLGATRLSGGWRLPWLIGLLKLALVAIDAGRLFLCLIAIGTAATFAQSSALAVSGVIGSVVSIVPAGLGVREAAAAGMAPLVGLAAASGFLAASLNRLLGLSVIMPIAALLLGRGYFGRKPTQ